MNKKIFITYGDSNYYKSLERIKKEAEASGEFDIIKIYTDKDLPIEVKNLQLYKYKRGGGYWVWKPYVCLDTLKNCDDSDIIVYSDCGNKIFKNRQWNSFWKCMQNHNAIFFFFGAVAKVWCRKSLMEFFAKRFPLISNIYLVQGNFFIFNKKAISVFEEWFDLMGRHPDFVIDVTPEERPLERHCFKESRHDQSVLSCVVYCKEKACNLLIARQFSERFSRWGQAIFNARISDDNVRSSMKFESIPNLILRIGLVVPYRNVKIFLLKQVSGLCLFMKNIFKHI